MSDEYIEVDGPSDSYCEGDPDPDAIDWNEVARLQRLQDEALDSDDVPMSMLGLLHEMHGDELEVL
jgi:hypothetical protein